ncbi:hypothetical protein EB118_08120 [bacterium]|nr:hypothetical protein [bacterium]
MKSPIIYAYAEIEKAYNILKEVIERENKLHEMDMTIMTQHLDLLEDEIIPLLEEIVYFDPSP